MNKLQARFAHPITALALVFALSTVQEKDQLAVRVEALEESLEDVQTSLESQAKAAKAFEAALAGVESAGFTAGINSNSRVAFLAALRSDLKVRAKGTAPEPAPEKEKPKRGSSRESQKKQ